MTIYAPHACNDSPGKLMADSTIFAARLHAFGVLPFSAGDSTAGMEYELQVAVQGHQDNVDLPTSIRSSSYYQNTIKRASRGDLPQKTVEDLKDFLDHNESQIWENSWVRFKERRLSSFALHILEHDLLADKKDPAGIKGTKRTDISRFKILQSGTPYLRIPISYLLKLAFADSLDSSTGISESLHNYGRKQLNHFQSDNTSPEILSFTIATTSPKGVGINAAKETARSFLVTQLLIQYANQHYSLSESGQHCIVYNAPLAPQHQKRLNELVPDGYYRHLFMSPCLSGWDCGEEKHRYMSLCHQTLSRSQLNALSKLKDVGIITNNLVVLPNTSSTCLANNGTHVSLGSHLLTNLANDPESGFTFGVETYLGDLVTKIVEHFLPLFVNTYTACPMQVRLCRFSSGKCAWISPT